MMLFWNQHLVFADQNKTHQSSTVLHLTSSSNHRKTKYLVPFFSKFNYTDKNNYDCTITKAKTLYSMQCLVYRVLWGPKSFPQVFHYYAPVTSANDNVTLPLNHRRFHECPYIYYTSFTFLEGTGYCNHRLNSSEWSMWPTVLLLCT